MTRYLKFSGFAAALVAATLFGSVVLSTADAEGPQPPRTNVDTVLLPPLGGWPPAPEWLTGETPNPTPSAVTDVDLGDLDVLSCSIVDGCSLPVAITTADGEVMKIMIITFEDPAPAEETP